MKPKPCPFCGAEAETDTQRGFREMVTQRFSYAVAIYCSKCSADMSMPHRDMPDSSPDEILSWLLEQWDKREGAK